MRAFAPEHFGLVFSAHAEIEKVRTRPGKRRSAKKGAGGADAAEPDDAAEEAVARASSVAIVRDAIEAAGGEVGPGWAVREVQGKRVTTRDALERALRAACDDRREALRVVFEPPVEVRWRRRAPSRRFSLSRGARVGGRR